MTRAEICENEKEYTLTLSGHSGKSEVCAGISTLSASLQGYLENIRCCHIYSENEGYCSFTVPKTPRTRGAVEMFIIGLLRIEKSCEGHVKVEIKN